MAKFLNTPAKQGLLGTRWELLLEPLDYDYGSSVPHTVPAGKLTDGPSVPGCLNWLFPRRKFMLSGYLHDDLRNKWTTGNAATDGMLRDAVMAESKQVIGGLNGLQAYFIYLGVRLGTLIGFKSAPPPAVIAEARKIWANRNNVAIQRVKFDNLHCELKIVSLP